MNVKLLQPRIQDLKHNCEKTSSPKFLGFLTSDELSLALGFLKNNSGYEYYGGYDNAERTVLAFLPDWCDSPTYPITALTFKYRECDTLGHRDFLGALMSLGITRETVGDILIGRGKTVIFVLNDIADFIISQITKIGRVGVNVSKGYELPLPNLSKKESFCVTVASMRLDGVVSALCGFSRKEAVEKITEGYVIVNSVCIEKTTYTVTSNDNITVRQKGKFEITSCDEFSKKGRIVLKYNKYV